MCHVPVAFAADTLREAAARATERYVAAEASASRVIPTKRQEPMSTTAQQPAGRRRASFQQTPRGLEGATGMGTGMKVLLGVGVAAALGGIMLSIDSRVEDNTPSTRGERTNEPF
jgi:hypothetical protein